MGNQRPVRLDRIACHDGIFYHIALIGAYKMTVEVNRLQREAASAQRAGDKLEAERLLSAILAIDAGHPGALNSLGVLALARGDHAIAESLFVRAVAADPKSPDLYLNVAKARRLQGDDAGEAESLRAALTLDQRHFLALLRLAELHERRGENQAATERWSVVLALIGMADPRTPELDSLAVHAADFLAKHKARLADRLAPRLANGRAAASSTDLRRFDACMDVALGGRRIYVNECHGLHYPFLPADEFFDRSLTPWLKILEEQTDVIRGEIAAILAAGGEGIAPYVAMEPGTPANLWTSLDHSLDWGALHLVRHGIRDEEVCARTPRTAEIVSRLPLSDIPGRTPTVFFSVLKPRTHLPAHSGVSNIRATVHLPLIVPDGCRFRVGGETRPWRVGEAWVFDDTMEHEAWNDSDELRVILICDVWNPYLSDQEKVLLRNFFMAALEEGEPGYARISD